MDVSVLALKLTLYLAFALWLVVGGYLLPNAYRAFTRHPRALDPVWAIICGLALNRLWFVGTAIAYGVVVEPAGAYVLNISSQLFGIAIAVIIILVRHWYGSGIELTTAEQTGKLDG